MLDVESMSNLRRPINQKPVENYDVDYKLEVRT